MSIKAVYTIDEVAEILDKSTDSIRAALRNKKSKLPAPMERSSNNEPLRWRKIDIDRYVGTANDYDDLLNEIEDRVYKAQMRAHKDFYLSVGQAENAIRHAGQIN